MDYHEKSENVERALRAVDSRWQLKLTSTMIMQQKPASKNLVFKDLLG